MPNVPLRLLYRALMLILWTTTPVCSQPTKVCLLPAQAAKIADSLAVLPLVRREAAAWHTAAVNYRSAADSLRGADTAHRGAYQQEQVASVNLSRLLANARAETADWKHKARRRGLLTYVLGAGLLGLGYFTLTH